MVRDSSGHHAPFQEAVDSLRRRCVDPPMLSEEDFRDLRKSFISRGSEGDMDTITKARHEAEIADVSERKLRLKSLELAVQAVGPGKPDDVTPAATKFLNFLIGLEGAAPARRE